jgi:hypothetical protein
MISKKTMLIAGLIFVLIVALSGCTSKEPVTAGSESDTTAPGNTQVQGSQNKTEVKSLDLFLAMGDNWDADAETDGIKLTLQPKDSKGNTVKANGTLSARLYENITGMSLDNKKGDLIQEWNNIKINKNNYEIFGVEVQLEYKPDFSPKASYETGWLDITFKTEDGKEFSATKDTVFLKKI